MQVVASIRSLVAIVVGQYLREKESKYIVDQQDFLGVVIWFVRRGQSDPEPITGP